MDKYKTTKFSQNNIETKEGRHIPIRIRIRFNPKLMAIVLSIGVFFSIFLTQHRENTDPIESIPTDTVESTPLIPTYFSHNGFLFSDSSTVRLSTSEIRGLRDVAAANGESYRNLLRYAVNEIYARHGYRFEAGLKFDKFYSQFEWYRVLPKQSTVAWAEFNEVERYNLGLLLAEEEKNGYR